MVRPGSKHNLTVLDGYAALRSVLGKSCRPLYEGSLSLRHLVSALGVRHRELHEAPEDSTGMVRVHQTLFAALPTMLKSTGMALIDQCQVYIEPF